MYSICVGFLALTVSACGGSPTDSGSGGGGGNNPPPTSKVELGISIEPEGGGTVSPSGGDYNKGSELSLTADPNDGWMFDSWSGDQTSSANPLDVTLNDDMELTANFSAVLNGTIQIVSGDQEYTFLFGQKEGATADFDSEIDVESPPPPPEGVIYGWFERDEYVLSEEYQSLDGDGLIWTLHIQSDESESGTLSWDLDSIDPEWSLELVSADDSVSIDMLEEDSLSIDSETPREWEIVFDAEP